MYATLEANSQCNKKEEKKKEDWKIVTAPLVNQSDRQRIKSMWTRRAYTLHVFFPDGSMLLLYSSFVLFSLERTSHATTESILNFFTIKKLNSKHV
jgi:hypothetical protein